MPSFNHRVQSADRTGTAKETRKDKRTNKSVTTERKYSTLEDVLRAIQPAAKLGIAHTQTFDYLPLEDGKSTYNLYYDFVFQKRKN